MKGLFCFIIKPKNGRYNNTKKVGDVDLILNTEIQNHNFVNRTGIVLATPINMPSEIQVGDEVIVHHNVFRRFHNVRGIEVNSTCYFDEDTYIVYIDQIFMYKRNNQWFSLDDYCFVKPIKNEQEYSMLKEVWLKGIIKYSNKNLEKIGLYKGSKIGFSPNSDYEFIIDNEKLYRVKNDSVTINYGHKEQEKEYNPSWL
jgi:hypothetical protein